jgi:hypothetical protein
METLKDVSHQWEFCALEYKAQDLERATPRLDWVVLLVLKDEKENLHFLVHPDLNSMVEGEDLDFMRSLLKDMSKRANEDPNALFKQISELSVGPLVTHEVGQSISAHPELLELLKIFK